MERRQAEDAARVELPADSQVLRRPDTAAPVRCDPCTALADHEAAGREGVHLRRLLCHGGRSGEERQQQNSGSRSDHLAPPLPGSARTPAGGAHGRGVWSGQGTPSGQLSDMY